MHKHYSPFISESTKNKIKERNMMKEQAVKSGSKELEKEAKKIGKQVKKDIIQDRRNYFQRDFSSSIVSSRNCWNMAKELLGQNKNLSPNSIICTNINGKQEKTSNPTVIANSFNKFFRNKVKDLRNKTNTEPQIPPSERLRSWLQTRSKPIPVFKFKMIDKAMFRQIMKKMKSNRTHGTDWIDSYSLKLAGPLIEDALMHLINLYLSENKISARWKPQLILPVHKKKEKR